MPDRPRASPPLPAPEALPEGFDDTAWLDVIHKMDEVYSQLVADEVALEEKNAQLEQSQQFIFSLLSAMSDVLVACDAGGGIEQTNRALAELTGRDEAALRGSAIDALMADEASSTRIRRVLGTPALQRDGTVIEVDLRDAAGQPVPVDFNCTPRFDAAGRRVGLVFVGRPMGELKRAYHQLREAHEALKRTQQQLVHAEKMASLGRLVAGVAHELNNPISFVLGNVYALQRYGSRMQEYLAALHAGKPAEEIAELRKTLRIDRLMEDMKPLIDGTIEGAERTRDIVAGLKRFSAQDRGEEETFNLAEVLERSVHWVVKASGSKIKVVVEVPKEIPVSGSAGQMQQVLVNLVQNAIDSTERQPDARLEIRAELRARSVLLTFRDNGPGFQADTLGHVFDPFFTTKPVGKGTGLGLSISYGIVERHRGQLKAANHPDGGAVLTLTLPLAG